MTERVQMVSDLANHLADKIHGLMMRDLLLMRAAGMSPHEGVAAVLHALERTSFSAFGMAVANTPRAERAAQAEQLIIEHAADLRTQIPKIIERLGELDARKAAR